MLLDKIIEYIYICREEYNRAQPEILLRTLFQAYIEGFGFLKSHKKFADQIILEVTKIIAGKIINTVDLMQSLSLYINKVENIKSDELSALLICFFAYHPQLLKSSDINGELKNWLSDPTLTIVNYIKEIAIKKFLINLGSSYTDTVENTFFCASADALFIARDPLEFSEKEIASVINALKKEFIKNDCKAVRQSSIFSLSIIGAKRIGYFSETQEIFNFLKGISKPHLLKAIATLVASFSIEHQKLMVPYLIELIRNLIKNRDVDYALMLIQTLSILNDIEKQSYIQRVLPMIISSSSTLIKIRGLKLLQPHIMMIDRSQLYGIVDSILDKLYNGSELYSLMLRKLLIDDSMINKLWQSISLWPLHLLQSLITNIISKLTSGSPRYIYSATSLLAYMPSEVIGTQYTNIEKWLVSMLKNHIKDKAYSFAYQCLKGILPHIHSDHARKTIVSLLLEIFRKYDNNHSKAKIAELIGLLNSKLSLHIIPEITHIIENPNTSDCDKSELIRAVKPFVVELNEKCKGLLIINLIKMLKDTKTALSIKIDITFALQPLYFKQDALDDSTKKLMIAALNQSSLRELEENESIVTAHKLLHQHTIWRNYKNLSPVYTQRNNSSLQRLNRTIYLSSYARNIPGLEFDLMHFAVSNNVVNFIWPTLRLLLIKRMLYENYIPNEVKQHILDYLDYSDLSENMLFEEELPTCISKEKLYGYG